MAKSFPSSEWCATHDDAFEYSTTSFINESREKTTIIIKSYHTQKRLLVLTATMSRSGSRNRPMLGKMGMLSLLFLFVWTYTGLTAPVFDIRVTMVNNSIAATTRHHSASETTTYLPPPSPPENPCAINFFGLPRAYDSLVLPSLIENVLKPNAGYRCDFFVHYYDLKFEQKGRSGAGGAIDPHAVRHLEQAVQQWGGGGAVRFRCTKEEEFWEQYKTFIGKIHTAKDAEGKPLYIPWKDRSYTKQTITNIVKMWHSIQESWKLMDSYSGNHSTSYSRIAVLRSDVFHMTPFDMFETFGGEANSTAVIPGFGKWPISDRMIVGPPAAVSIWASKRFSHLKRHVKDVYKYHRGYGMHEERFLKYTVFPAIRRAGVDIVEHKTLCFLRARAHDALWVEDCAHADPNTKKIIGLASITDNMGGDVRGTVEKLLGRQCGNETNVGKANHELECPVANSSVEGST